MSALPLAAPAAAGRRFVGQRKVRLGDVRTDGVLRFDALTRYTQDVSDDDTTDAGLGADPAWVVRRTVVDVLAPARLGETIEVTTFCSGLGRRWAERRLRIVGDGGGRYEVATLWICVDPGTGRPAPLTEQFIAIYGPAAAGRTVKARLTVPKPESGSGGTRSRRPWPLRAVDFDTLGHVNNAAYWAVIEEIQPRSDAPQRVVVEYSAGLAPGDDVAIETEADDQRLLLWWLTGDGVAAAASVSPLPPHLYGPEEDRRYQR